MSPLSIPPPEKTFRGKDEKQTNEKDKKSTGQEKSKEAE